MSEELIIRLEPPVDGLVRLGWFMMDGVDPMNTSPAFEADLEQLCVKLRQEYDAPAAAAPRNRPARVLYRAVGVDPTKNRPSSEALLRRVLTGKPLYRVNAVVDAANLCSLDAALPVGLYDEDGIRGSVSAALGQAGDGYQGIGKGRVNLDGKLMLRDDEGPFGNPSADSFRTRIREETRRILFIYFVPAGMPLPDLERMTGEAAVGMSRYTGGQTVMQGVAPVRD